MIVWLASFPRAGNTLLRTVLHQSLGCATYSDEIDPDLRRTVGFPESVERSYGRTELPQPWEEFYLIASASVQTYFVKTHLPPRDAQPAIYVVRDGRQTLLSYAKFHRLFQNEHGKTLLQLVLGDDYYGGWSQHFASWTGRADAPTLVVRYEELAVATDALLLRIAKFAGHRAPVRSWNNPFDQMNAANPSFFASGRTRWSGDAEWTPAIDAAFFQLHGELMECLGYAGIDEVASARSRFGPVERELVVLSASLASRCRSLDQVCRERLTVIEGLDRACRERLALIERLTAGARSRET